MSETKVPSSKIPSYWWIEDAVAHSLNRLKGQIFNLIEASVPEERQQEALKGLIRGFANEEFRRCVVDMRDQAREAGLLPKGEDSDTPPLSVYPLESRLNG